MAAKLVGRTAIRARIADLSGPWLTPEVEAAAHVICRMGGHIPHIDNEQPGSCDFHRRQAAVALEQAGTTDAAVTLRLMAYSLNPRARQSISEGARWVRLPANHAEYLLGLLKREGR